MNRMALTQSQVAAVALMLADSDDEQLKLDTLEGQTDLFEITRYLLGKVEEDEGVISALAEQISDRQARKQSAENRIKRRREAMMALIQAAKLEKLTLPEATLSVRAVAPKPLVTDEAAVPDEYCKVIRKPDLTAIKAGMESGAVISGVSTDNGGYSLTVRRK
jgi:hypothetical protein